MPNASVVRTANAAGRRLATWAADPSAPSAGPLAGHEHAVVPAFAGAGKSYHLTHAARHAVNGDARVIVTAGTNDQVRDLAVRLHRLGLQVVHYSAHGQEIVNPPRGLVSAHDLHPLRLAQIVVVTVYSAGRLAHANPREVGQFDLGFIDESYQVRSDTAAMQALTLADRWGFVGDPGQIDVFTRLGTSPFLGHDDPVSSVVASSLAQGADLGRLEFDWTWRLPHHGADLLAPFYGQSVVSAAEPGDRVLTVGPRRLRPPGGVVGRAAEEAVDRAAHLGWGYLELSGDPLDAADPETAAAVAAAVDSILARGSTATCERDGTRLLTPGDVGAMVATDAQRSVTEQALAAVGRADVQVRTYNKAQGLEFAVSVLWHPLSGVEEASGFSLDLGRLCVGVSRHRQACVLVGQHGLRTLLEDPPLSPDAPWPGARDRLLAGWLAHSEILARLDALGARVAA